MNIIKLSPAEETAWMKVRTVLTWTCPGFSHIFYTMLNNSDGEHVAMFTDAVPVAATDGSNIILNPATFFKYKLSEQVFIIAHEILHNVFDHPRMNSNWQKAGFVKYVNGDQLPYSSQLMNVAEDLHINDILINSGVGQYNKNWLYSKAFGRDDAVVDIYWALYNKFKPDGESFDRVLPPGFGVTPGSKPPPERNKAQWEMAIAAAAHITKEHAKGMQRQRGLQALGLARTLDKLNEPVVTWSEKLHSLFVRKVGTGGYDFSRPDRRLMARGIFSPARSSFQAGDIVVACDTSGSMSEAEISMCFGEVGGILEQLNPRRIFLLWCDAEVHRADELDDIGDLYEAKKHGAPGGGGTDFRPVFEWIKEHCDNMPDALVFFTDGFGAYPEHVPHYPVLWGNITPHRKYPFGDVIDIPMGDH